MGGAEASLLREAKALNSILTRGTPQNISHANRAREARYLEPSAPKADQGHTRLGNKHGVVGLYGQEILQ